ncbi:HXXXD-type acyl-transferase-like protein [Rhynchospora pubera]|uniref:HXXXD-type acyl-transferase-like protein n=1 Tax=Rhynchospora pubera TaxID=906938 RepID=A0AAV8FN43_9POAL|nr:HXXXD-type acyl-transferase-like protein [Rhynchospora pubera]
MPSSPTPSVRTIKTYAVTPRPNPEVPRKLDMSSWDVPMLCGNYIQKGLLFKYPPDLSVEQIIQRLRNSLEEALFHFYPLSGRLRIVTCEGGGVTCHVEVGIDGEGAEFVHAVADEIRIADVVAADALGIFIGCVFNHAIADGTSYWHFYNAWAEISRGKAVGKKVVLSRLPVHDKWFIGGYGEPPIKLPYSSPVEIVVRFSPPPLRERMFHFTSESLAKLKARANHECGKGTISTFQALSALMWRCITRARGFAPEQKTSCRLAIQNRTRLQPQLPPNYFGNSVYAAAATTTAAELLNNNLGLAAWLVHEVVSNHTDSAIRDMVHTYMQNPIVYNLHFFDKHSIMMGSSPRFDMYGCDFGWGKALAARSGSANKFDGKVSAYPGWEGGGSIDLEVCLLPEYMSALERDEEFLAVVSPPIKLEVLLGISDK